MHFKIFKIFLNINFEIKNIYHHEKMNPFYAYSFLVGMFIGGYTNFFSKIIISGLVLYMVNPENFHIERFNPLYLTLYDYTHPYISKFYTLEENKIERVTIMPSPINLPPIKTLKIIK